MMQHERAANESGKIVSQIGKTKEHLQSDIQELREVVRSAIEEKFVEYSQEGKQAANSLEERVREEPFKSMLAAAGAGLILGLIVRGSR